VEFSYGIPAGEDTIFAPGAFDNVIGKKKPFKYQLKDKPMREVQSTIEKVEITNDGKEAIMTISIPEDAFRELFGARKSYDSFSFIEKET
jgi:hypothetical protein